MDSSGFHVFLEVVNTEEEDEIVASSSAAYRKGSAPEIGSAFLGPAIENQVKLTINSEREVAKHKNVYSKDGSRGRKNPPEHVDLECGRMAKQSAGYTESTVRSDVFDLVLLSSGDHSESALREAFQSMKLEHNNERGGRHNKKRDKRRVVDMTTLLTLCAEDIAANKIKEARDRLKEIRQHSSPTGDGMQRFGSYFADALEARLAGSTTTPTCNIPIVARKSTASMFLKAHHVFVSVCPFVKLSHFFANKTIMRLAERATKLHIVDFGIQHGFQWPSLIEQLSSRPGGPPKLHITGIDFPKQGFKPADLIDGAGCRIAAYAERFKVPFKFDAITRKWETVKIEDIEIEEDEVLVVNCMYKFRYLLDESVVEESPRDTVLRLVRQMNPSIFIQANLNAAYTTPYFTQRFKETMRFNFSYFDILENTVPREIPERMLLEKELLGLPIMNAVAFEGPERTERLETYRQWQARNQRAGFAQLPLDKEIVKRAKKWVATVYHKDFLVEEDGRWLLKGWKGQILSAITSWRPI